MTGARSHTKPRDVHGITRRAALGALGAGAAGFALFGPRGRETIPAGRIVLDYWEKWRSHEGAAMQAIVDTFNASQTRIHVRMLVVSDIGQKSVVAIAGGRPPDIIGLYGLNIVPYAESGAILPLDDLAPAAGVRREQYLPGVHRVTMHQGKWWGTPNTSGSIALYYNRTLFREAGLDPDHPPRTVAELDEMHARLTTFDDKAITRAGFLQREPGWWSWMWAYHFGGRIYDEAANRATIDSPENIAVMRWMQSYPLRFNPKEFSAGAGATQDGRMPRFVESFGNYFTPENPFLTGKVAMIVQGPWVANLIQAYKPGLDYGVVPFPTIEGTDDANPVGALDMDVLVIPRGAKNPEASMEFIAFTQRQDMTEQLALKHFKTSPLAVASDEYRRAHPNRGIAVHEAILRSEKAYTPPRTRVWQQFKDEFDTRVKQIWQLEASPETAMTALQPRVQSLIDLARSQQQRRYGADRGAHHG
jgi:multiple sugar transport system substrate-binding protein